MILPLFDDYLLFLKTNKYSAETIYNYERDLTTFINFLSSSPETDFNKISKKTIDQYKAYLVSHDRQTPIKNEEGVELSAQSINRMLSAIRSFLKYLVDRDEPVPIPPEAIKLVKTEKKHPRVAELEELTRLIESPQALEKDPLIGLRNRAIFEVLFSTGMRISELVRLNKADIDKTGRVFIMGKGKKERFVYLTPRALNILERYLVTRNDNFEALFIPYSGPNINDKNKRLSTNYIQAKIKKYREKLKINVPVSAHSLRHGFATYLAEEGASPAAIQILLGHESLDTTTRYVHASDRFAEETHRKFHPLKNRKSLS
ncbi:MAG: tyrosine-type recombinase/integrase [Candidatus Shapirobacteria bacterium]|nr:tyrosine-type recombinase/integrase [Candidatus Shapirobacteria bacterium]